ncbi:MAG: hypothetical protein RLZZ387_978 [Chloroflexota bacterium]|jgi:sigma-B regulation protein RsbU (phosphoserine phosphatase)
MPRVPLIVKIVTPLVLLIAITVGVSGYQVYQQSAARWQSEMDERLERVARLVARSVDVAELRQIRRPSDVDSPAYRAVRLELDQAATAANLSWISVYYREFDFLYYWVDTGATGVGYPFFYATPAHLETFRDREVRRVTYTDEFGSYYGVVAPIIEEVEGVPQVVGIVEVAMTNEAAALLARDTLQRVAPILLGGVAMAVGVSLLVTWWLFNRPLRRLQRGAMVLASGQFGHTIDLGRGDELGDLADTFNQMSTQLERLYRERGESERVQRELEIAHNVQQAIFPAQMPRIPGIELAAYCRPHRETSGDFFDLLVLSDGRLGLMVGDVSGKSIPAAMLMVAAHSTIRSEAFDHFDPAQVLSEANGMLCRNVPRGMFVAASYALIDPRSLEMVWANAGQMYPLLRSNGGTLPPDDLRYLEVRGAAFPLGMSERISYTDQRLSLAPGDTLLFYTDGVVEAMDLVHELYGFERLERLVRSLPADVAPQALVEAVLEDVARFVGPAEQHDDITLLAVKLRHS